MRSFFCRGRARTGWCLGLLLAAVLLRLLTIPGVRAELERGFRDFLRSDRLLRTLVYLETGGKLARRNPERETAADPGVGQTEAADRPAPMCPSTVPAPEGETAASADGTETAAPSEAPAEAAEPPFTPEEAEAISLRGNCGYKPDVTELLLRPLDWTDGPGPKLLIIHTHSSEAYTPSPGHSYTPDGEYRTAQTSETVVAVGDVLAETLGDLGVEVIHDRTCCDYPSYNRSYAVARGKIEAWLERYPSIRMVIDLHRDAMDPPVRELAEADGEKVAALMLVVGTDEGGLSHPRWADNLSCALKLQALANRSYPGLFKAISFRRERFNGDLTPGSLIVEVGSTENTLPEALASMPYLARWVAELLNID